MSKSIKIIIFIALVTGSAVGVYFLWQYLSPGQVPEVNNPLVAQNNSSATSLVKALPAENVLDFWINKKDDKIYYITSAGQVLKLTDTTAGQIISSQNIPNINYIKPSFDGSMALIAFGYPQTPSFSVFNIAKKSFRPLPAGTVAAALEPQANNRIVYLNEGAAGSKLNIMDLNTGKTTEILKINQKDVVLDWPFLNIIYFRDRVSHETLGSLWSYNLQDKKIKILSQNELGLNIEWWSNKDLGLEFTNGLLYLINQNGNRTDIVGLKTSPTKCWFGEPLIYCAAQRNQSLVKTKDLLELTPRLDAVNNDILYSIVSVGIKSGSRLYAAELPYDLTEIVPLSAVHIEKTGNDLIILNQLDRKLYRLSL